MGHFQLAGPSWAVVPGLTLVVLAILSGVETRWLDLDGRFRVRYFYLHHAPSEVPNTQREHLKPTWHATWHHGGKYLQKAPCTILSSVFAPSSLPLRSLSLTLSGDAVQHSKMLQYMAAAAPVRSHPAYYIMLSIDLEDQIDLMERQSTVRKLRLEKWSSLSDARVWPELSRTSRACLVWSSTLREALARSTLASVQPRASPLLAVAAPLLPSMTLLTALKYQFCSLHIFGIHVQP